jgi:exonuclease VII small subunit
VLKEAEQKIEILLADADEPQAFEKNLESDA